MTPMFLPKPQLQHLITILTQQKYQVLGPQVRDQTIVYEPLESVEQLPRGIRDIQSPGKYVLTETQNNLWFGWANGPQAIKPLCFSPQEILWESSTTTHTLDFQATLPETGLTAILGVRACDIAALKLQDQHFLHGEYIDPYYKARRQSLLVIGVDCSHPADTCFCNATGDGPCVSDGADIVLTELNNGFLIHADTPSGKAVTNQLTLIAPSKLQLVEAEKQNKEAAERQTRGLPNANIQKSLNAIQSHQHWEDIGKRCLACGNCTAVCPSCFCHSEHDESDIEGNSATHVRQWDSCFNQQHSYIHGIIIRGDTSMRYRQWLTHKFAHWVTQYGRSGCTGCGRCITWCPVGIDVTLELATLCNEACIDE